MKPKLSRKTSYQSHSMKSRALVIIFFEIYRKIFAIKAKSDQNMAINSNIFKNVIFAGYNKINN
jgi:hypothetical protein